MGADFSGADRQSSVEPDHLSPDDAYRRGQQNGAIGLYDGENERPDAWQANGDTTGQMRWSRKQPNHRAPSPSLPTKPAKSSRSSSYQKPNLSRRSSKKSNNSRSPFALGDADDESDPDPDSPVSPAKRPLPSDAVDLVVEDTSAAEEARQHERRKGEPQTHAPAHIFKAQRTTSDMKVDRVQQVYSPDPAEGPELDHVHAGEAPGGDPVDIVESIEKVVEEDKGSPENKWNGGRLYQTNDDNPWA